MVFIWFNSVSKLYNVGPIEVHGSSNYLEICKSFVIKVFNILIHLRSYRKKCKEILTKSECHLNKNTVSERKEFLNYGVLFGLTSLSPPPQGLTLPPVLLGRIGSSTYRVFSFIRPGSHTSFLLSHFSQPRKSPTSFSKLISSLHPFPSSTGLLLLEFSFSFISIFIVSSSGFYPVSYPSSLHSWKSSPHQCVSNFMCFRIT